MPTGEHEGPRVAALLLGPRGAGRTRSLIFVLLTLLALGTAVADGATAAQNIARWGLAGEGNPFAQWVLASHGCPGLLALKLGGISWAALVAWLLYRVDHFGKTCMLLGFAAAVNVTGAITNITA
jgi:hypothetical protein